jgi:mRNA interferase MazF
MIRGAVYPIDLGDAKRGHEQRGRRLGLVISIEQDAWSTVTVLSISTSAQASVFPAGGRHSGARDQDPDRSGPDY